MLLCATCNVLLDAPSLPRLVPGVPTWNANTCLLEQTCRNGNLAGEKDCFSRWPCGMMVLQYLYTPYGVPGCIRHHPGCITVSYGREVVVNVREDLRVRVISGTTGFTAAGSSGSPSTCLRKTQEFCVAIVFG